MENQLFELARKRRSIRQYGNKRIDDGAIASAYLLLAIEQYDLGACWVHIRNRKGKLKSSDEEIRQLLNIPDGYTVLNLVALGEKGEIKAPYTEKDLKFGNIHMEKF